jgi:kinesin family protein 11
MSAKTSSLQEALTPLDENLRQPLAELRSNITNTILQEYTPTGGTPQKVQYQYPMELPHTEAHETLLAALRRPGSSTSTTQSPNKMIPVIFNDAAAGDDEVASLPSSSVSDRPTGGLREIDLNINAGSLNSGVESAASGLATSSSDAAPPLFKRSITAISMKLPKSVKKPSVVALEGRENTMVPVFSQSTGRRRSPRTG